MGQLRWRPDTKAHQSLGRENIETSGIKSPCKALCKEDFAVTTGLGMRDWLAGSYDKKTQICLWEGKQGKGVNS